MFLGTFFLIYWPGENSVTAVPSKSIVEPEGTSLKVADCCKVKYACNAYDGRVVAIGKCDFGLRGNTVDGFLISG